MSNSYITSKSCASPSATHSEDSDTEQQSKGQNNYEYLLNELKMKSTALAKASNLIQILQVELEVQKSSKKEAIQAAEESIRSIYNMEIMNLNHKIESLQHALERKKAAFATSTEVSVCQSLPRQQSRLLRRSCSKSLNRSVSKQNLNARQKTNKQVISSQNSLQSKMYRKMLLINSRWDNQFIQDFQQLTVGSQDQIHQLIQNMQQKNEQFSQIFSQRILISIETTSKIKQLQELILYQNQIIGQMKMYQNQLQEIIKNSAEKITELMSIQEKYIDPINEIGDTRCLGQGDVKDVVRGVVAGLNRLKDNWRNREKRMQEENKELREIIEEMILLINKKKQTTTKSCNYRIS